MVCLYGPKKVGKSVLLSSIPDAFFLICEQAGIGVEVFGERVENWEQVRDLTRALEKEAKKKNPRFSTVVIDTYDMFFLLGQDFICRKKGVSHPNQANDYGATWKASKDENVSVLSRLIRAGYGVILTSHSREREIKRRSGEKYDKIMPTMTGQALDVVDAMAHVVMFADYVETDVDDYGEAWKNDARVLFTVGDEHIYAGVGKPFKPPAIIPLLEENGWQTVEDAFAGKHSGIDPSRIRIGLETRLVSEDELEKIQEKGGAKKRLVGRKLGRKK